MAGRDDNYRRYRRASAGAAAFADNNARGRHATLVRPEGYAVYNNNNNNNNTVKGLPHFIFRKSILLLFFHVAFPPPPSLSLSLSN